MELTVIGSGTVSPTAHRTSACHWVTTGSTKIMLDCGAGALHRAAQFNVPWHEVTHLAITHFHIDHWGELAHFLFALRWGIEPSRQEPLTIIGPHGLETRLVTLAATYGDWVEKPGFPLTVIPIASGERLPLAEGVQLEAQDTPHTPESLAYSIETNESRLVYTGDTGPSSTLAQWARGCNLLLCECSLPDDRAIDMHLTPSQAGSLAREAQAGQLVLTHFYPPVETVNPVQQAANAFGGPVTAASDGSHFVIGG